MIAEWLTFVIIMALGQFSPGPDMILLTRVALADGLRAGVATAAGIATGLMVHATIAIGFIGGLNALLSERSLLTTIIYILAACYLLWIAFSLLKSAKQHAEPQFTPVNSITRSLLVNYQKGLFCNLLNPKVAIFLASITLPFFAVHTSFEWRLILWLTIFLEGLILWCLWVKLLQTSHIRKWYAGKSHIIDRLFALALIILAGIIIFNLIN